MALPNSLKWAFNTNSLLIAVTTLSVGAVVWKGDHIVGDLGLIFAAGCTLLLLYRERARFANIARHVFIYWGLVLLALLMMGWVGASFGLQQLVFHDSARVQLFNGISTSLFTALVFFLIFALDRNERDRFNRQARTVREHESPLALIRRNWMPINRDSHSLIFAYVIERSISVCTMFFLLALGLRFFDERVTAAGWYCFGVIVGLTATCSLGIRVSPDRIISTVRRLHYPYDRATAPRDPDERRQHDRQITKKNKGIKRLARLPALVLGSLYCLIVLIFWINDPEYSLEKMPVIFSLNLTLMAFASIAGWLHSQRPGAPLLTFLATLAAVWALNGIRFHADNQHKFTFEGLSYAEDSYVPLDSWLYQNVALRSADMSGRPQKLLMSRDINEEKQELKMEWIGEKNVDINRQWMETTRKTYGYLNELYERPEDPVPEYPIAVVVTVSGGGIRAAYWTALVLRELEMYFADQDIYFPAHVRIITGASGGMLAASHYVATVREPSELSHDAHWKRKRRHKLNQIVQACGYGTLTPVVNHLLFKDLPGMFVPWQQAVDRGKELEQEWSEAWNPEAPENWRDSPLQYQLAGLREGERDGWRPSIAFTPMLAEDGRRLIVSNLDFSRATRGIAAELMPQESSIVRNKGNDLHEEGEDNFWRSGFRRNVEVQSSSAVEFFRLFPDSHITLSTATRMSATFPYVSPAVSLPTIPVRHVVDAGYYDNYGVNLAAQWIQSNHKLIYRAELTPKEEEARRQKAIQSGKDPADTTKPQNEEDIRFGGILLIRIRDHSSATVRREMDLLMAEEMHTTSANGSTAYPDWKEAFGNNDPTGKLCRGKGADNRPALLAGSQNFQTYLNKLRNIKQERKDGRFWSNTNNASLRWLSTPWIGLEQARQASMMYRNDEQVEMINESLPKGDNNRRRVMTVVFDCPINASLSWYLSEAEKRRLDQAIDSLQMENKLNELTEWWKFAASTDKPASENTESKEPQQQPAGEPSEPR